MSWRPKDWDDIIEYHSGISSDPMISFEYGVEAILEVLKRGGHRLHQYKCWVVIIPDE